MTNATISYEYFSPSWHPWRANPRSGSIFFSDRRPTNFFSDPTCLRACEPRPAKKPGLQPCQFDYYKMTVADDFCFGGERAAGIKKRRVAQPFLTERPAKTREDYFFFFFSNRAVNALWLASCTISSKRFVALMSCLSKSSFGSIHFSSTTSQTHPSVNRAEQVSGSVPNVHSPFSKTPATTKKCWYRGVVISTTPALLDSTQRGILLRKSVAVLCRSS